MTKWINNVIEYHYNFLFLPSKMRIVKIFIFHVIRISMINFNNYNDWKVAGSNIKIVLKSECFLHQIDPKRYWSPWFKRSWRHKPLRWFTIHTIRHVADLSINHCCIDSHSVFLQRLFLFFEFYSPKKIRTFTKTYQLINKQNMRAAD